MEEKYGNVLGGKLSLKGGLQLKEKKKKKKRKRDKESTELDSSTIEKSKKDDIIMSASLTKAQKKHKKYQKRKEEKDLEAIASKTYRERVEEYNARLASLSEHHDVPRVSAAGNG